MVKETGKQNFKPNSKHSNHLISLLLNKCPKEAGYRIKTLHLRIFQKKAFVNIRSW